MATQLPRTNFSHNWNGKLFCDSFTTLRLWNPSRYRLNDFYRIFLNDEEQGTAQLIGVRKLHTSKINEFIAFLDTGYNADKTRAIIAKMYQSHDDLLMGFYLFKWVERIPHTLTNVKKLSA